MEAESALARSQLLDEEGELDEATEDWIQRMAAGLVMTVTLMAAVFAFLQSQTGNRETSSERRSQEAAVRTMGYLVEGNRLINQERATYQASNDHGWLAYYLGETAFQGGVGSDYANALSKAHTSSYGTMAGYTKSSQKKYLLASGAVDWNRFDVDQFRSSYLAAEYAKAHARQRDSWGSKGARYVTAITLLALALFLFGISTTVSGNARLPFLAMGALVALLSGAWGLRVWQEPAPKVEGRAITHFVDGKVENDIGRYAKAIAPLTNAVGHDNRYGEAFFERGSAYFFADLLAKGGPKGSEPAKHDFQRAIDLGHADAITWGSLGASEWWLDEYKAAVTSTQKALELNPNNLAININYGDMLYEVGTSYEQATQMDRIEELMAKTPSWLRDYVVENEDYSIDLAIKYRPELADAARRYRKDLHALVERVEKA